MCLKKLFGKINFHRRRRDEDLQARPAGPEKEAARPGQKYELRPTRGPNRKERRMLAKRPVGSHWGRTRCTQRGAFGNPRWTRAAGRGRIGA